MQRLEVGKLYSCSEYFIMLYPDRETAASAAGYAAAGYAAAARAAAYWSRKLEKPVIYAEKNIPLLVLNTSDEYVEVLAGDQRGWAICPDWLNIKEITDDAA